MQFTVIKYANLITNYISTDGENVDNISLNNSVSIDTNTNVVFNHIDFELELFEDDSDYEFNNELLDELTFLLTY
jgi:hypothetical protein